MRPPKKRKRSHLEEWLARDIQLRGLPAPEIEYRFMAHRFFRFDFAWPTLWIAVEVQGGAYIAGSGAHGHGAKASIDNAKAFAAAALGWTLIAVDAETVKSGLATRWIAYMIARRRLEPLAGGREQAVRNLVPDEAGLLPLLPPPAPQRVRASGRR